MPTLVIPVFPMSIPSRFQVMFTSFILLASPQENKPGSAPRFACPG